MTEQVTINSTQAAIAFVKKARETAVSGVKIFENQCRELTGFGPNDKLTPLEIFEMIHLYAQKNGLIAEDEKGVG